jgi:hypothetical protein
VIATEHRIVIVGAAFYQDRYQLARDLTLQDGPQVQVVPFTEVAARLPYYDGARVSPEEWRARIAARQAAVAMRMLG